MHQLRRLLFLAAPLLCAQPGLPAEARITAAEFAARALPALPIERPHDFRKTIETWTEPLRRNPAAKPAANELALPAQGWTLAIPAASSPVLRQAAEDFRDYLSRAMQVRVELNTPGSLAEWSGMSRAIVAGTRDQMPGCGDALAGRKDYQIVVAPERIAVCGYDERGAMYGLYNLEARMSMRQAPFLPRDLNTVRHSLYGARMTLSGLGWMEWPDTYLSMIAHHGFDAIYASVYANPNGVIAGWPYNYMMRRQNPARMRDLIQRAARYGLDVYAPIMHHLDGTPENEAVLRKLVRDNVNQFPEIRGYVLLIEGFDYERWPSWNRGDIRKWIDAWTHGVAIAAEEMHKINPAIEVLAWDYNIDFRARSVDTKRYVIDRYAQDVIPLVTWENGKSFMRDGEEGYLKDYAINEVGPAEVSAAQIERARQRGMKVFAKADTFASWQFGTFPYLPFPYQWHARYEQLEKHKIDGTMESWSYGFKPNWVAELRNWYSWSDAPPLNDLLKSIARREFGPGSEDLALTAWDHFSKAIALLPDTGPNMGTTNSIGSPFFFQEPKVRAVEVEHSWAIPGVQAGGLRISKYWPYAPERVILVPDFTNKTNTAARYASPFSLPVFNKYLLAAAGEMEKGLESYRRAALQAPVSKRRTAFREVLLAEQLQRMMRSDQAILEFEDLRLKLAKAADPAEKSRTVNRMATILRQEVARTQAARDTQMRDSRLGYEWEQDYFYTPEVLAEKIQQLRGALDREIPAYRKQHGLKLEQ
ncbi:MAG TPA: hypothetical protein VN442_04940 [Bryobacteraceae bacterium]|nr:hypothetical protein [Bryobacteraceae bacterium]